MKYTIKGSETAFLCIPSLKKNTITLNFHQLIQGKTVRGKKQHKTGFSFLIRLESKFFIVVRPHLLTCADLFLCESFLC